MDKKYLISGEKDGVTYYYKDIDAHDRLDIAEANITKEKEERIKLDDRLTTEVTSRITESQLNAAIEGVSANIPAPVSTDAIKDAVLAEVRTTLDNYQADHSRIRNEIKKATVFFEVKDAPVGTLVDCNCKEIRIMCPETTDWENYTLDIKKNLPDDYKYVAFYAYAPDNAEKYSEVVGYEYPNKEVIGSRETKTPYTGINYSGVDMYMRKYSIYYFPVAERQPDGTWLYLGKKSDIKDYNGWYYSIEWYNSNDVAVKSETVRVNLATEDNFRYIEPVHEYSIWAKYLDLSEKYQALLARIETLEEREN